MVYNFSMKNFLTCSIHAFCLAVILSPALIAESSGSEQWLYKLEPRLRRAWYLETGRAGPLLSAKEAAKKPCKVILRFADDQAVVQLPGVRILARKGDIATATIDPADLPLIAASPAIKYITADSYDYPHDDPGVLSVRAARVPPKLGITGKGVLIGILDSGIDWQHRDFRNGDGSSRIAAILDLSDSIDSLSSGDLGAESPYGGILVMKEDIDKALLGQGTIRQRDYMGHGTHVAGVAAASPAGEGDTINVFGGVAPGAEIIAVKLTDTPMDSAFSQANIMNGLHFVDSLARALGRPYVVNMSFGGSLGSHDGRSSYERFIAGFTDPSQAGRAVVVSAGNEREIGWHAAGNFTESPWDSIEVIEMEVQRDGVGDRGWIELEIWLSEGHAGVDLGLFTPDTSIWSIFKNGYSTDTTYFFSDAGIFWVSNAFGGPDREIGDRKLEVTFLDAGWFEISGPEADIRIAEGLWYIAMRGRTGSFNAYLSASYGIEPRFTTHESELGTVAVPATTPELISVGSYSARTDWAPLEQQVSWASEVFDQPVAGELSYFSSLGPNRKGVLKPEITAPGQYIMSTLSSFAWPVDVGSLSMYWTRRGLDEIFFATDSIHAAGQGTSLSAPIVAGICALLLEADPNLTHEEIKNILTVTASTDSMVTGVPNNYWGYGRANAIDALASVVDLGEDSLALAARLTPEYTPQANSLEYSITADFTRSLQSLKSFELEVQWPTEILTPGFPLDQGSNPQRLQLVYDTTRISTGVLEVTGFSPQGLPAIEQIVGLVFDQRAGVEIDSVSVTFQVTSVQGDLQADELAETVSVFQASPLALTPWLFCQFQGDVDLSGQVNIFDLLELLKILTGKLEENACSDINQDGVTNIFDLIGLLQLL